MKRRDPLTILSGGDLEWRKRWLAGLAKAGGSPVFGRRERGFSPFDVTHVLVEHHRDHWPHVGWAIVRLKRGRWLVVTVDATGYDTAARAVSLRDAVQDDAVREHLHDPDLRRATRWLRDPFKSMAALAALGAAP